MKKFFFYRVINGVWHRLSAWNTSGEGIHSPSLFYLVRFLFPRVHRYYRWAEIEDERDRRLRSSQVIPVTDYGTGTDTALKVASIAATHLEQPAAGELFFKLIVHLKHELNRPLNIVELGTSLGITTAYLAAPHSANRVTTYEGNPATLKLAQETWKKLGLKNITSVLGNIDDTLLNNTHTGEEKIDFVFVDANHRQEPTIQYVMHFLPRLHDRSIVVVDDLYHSPEMTRAWKQLCDLDQVTSTINGYHFGLLFFDPHLLKRHYRIRI